MRTVLRQLLPPLLAFFFFTLLFEFLVQSQWISSYLIPAPSQVFRTLIEYKSDLSQAFIETGLNAAWGLTASLIVGFFAAVLFSLSSWLEKALLPVAVFFQTVPIVAIAPLLVIWFGFGSPTVRASSFIVSFFPILASMWTGLRQTPPGLLDVFRLYQASRWQKLWKLQLPSSLPFLISGLRTASGLAVIGAIVGEFVGGSGLGSLIDSARTQQRTDLVFSAVLLSTLLGFFYLALVECLDFFWKRTRRIP